MMNANNNEQIYDLVRYAFNKPDTAARRQAFEWLSDHSYIYTKESNNHISSHVMATPFSFRLHDAIVKMAGIGYVATLPEYRGNGDIYHIFNEMFMDLHEKQVVVSFLAPFSQKFYRRLGYENVCQRFKYHFNHQALAYLPKIKDGHYDRVSFDEQCYNRLSNIYNSTLGLDNGSIQRESWWWRYKNMKINNAYVVFYTYDQEESYMIYHIDHQNFYIDEVAYHNIHELIALLNFASSHQMTVTDYYMEDARQHIEMAFTDSIPLNITVQPYMMARIQEMQLFLEAILSKLNVPTHQPCYLDIYDKQCPWNDGIWQLTTEGVQKFNRDDDNHTHHSQIHYHGNIQAFSQLFISGYSMHQLHYNTENIITVRPHPSIEQWKQDNIHLYDYF